MRIDNRNVVNNTTQPSADLIEKSKDDAAISLIKGLDLLIAHARAYDLPAAVRMIFAAKESLVYWAADQNFYESDEDRFINKHLMDNSLLSLIDLAAKNACVNENRFQAELILALQNNVKQKLE